MKPVIVRSISLSLALAAACCFAAPAAQPKVDVTEPPVLKVEKKRAHPARVADGLAPEITDINAADVSYAAEAKIPDIKKPFLSTSPAVRNDGIPAGALGEGQKDAILAFAKQIAAYLEHSAPIPPMPREFKYQGPDPSIAMQVIEAVVPGSARDFIKTEVLGKLHTNQQGTSYGFFWWRHEMTVGDKSYGCRSGRGACGQFILMLPELELIAVVTAHNKGMGTTLKSLPELVILAFLR